ncbi:NAD(P)/FAD-dependent oxidoreductase [Hoeflea sp.]|uniref:NAD(P)/FAD-dependent oxidoreductase n=1 Tax=Hoeflea sp. TaxID=1940281 RepID=UPI0037483C00
MVVADSGPDGTGQPSPDLVVVGAGVAGLWLALKAARAGLSVALIERGQIGNGASGGFLGALMPHSPERWNGKKEFQFRALVDLEDEVARLEGETGLPCGYRRVGRLLPLPSGRARETALENVAQARANWGARFSFDVAHTPDKHDWPSILWAPHGIVNESLSARLSPPALLAALSTRLAALPNVTVRQELALTGIDHGRRVARLSDGSELAFGHMALANGVDAFGFVAEAYGVPDLILGGPVKGQAALLNAAAPPDSPLVYYDGIYVLVHQNGLVAIGSTSEREFDHPTETDEQLDDLIKRARKLCPLIKEAPVVGRWANVRPRAVGRDPMLGPVPAAPHVLAMAGGFKISFGIAHRMADCLVAGLAGKKGPDVPESFAVESHAAKAAKAKTGP